MVVRNGSSNTRKTARANDTDGADSSVVSPTAEAQGSGITAETDLGIAPLETVMSTLAIDVTQGLSTAEAEERRARYGSNELATQDKKPLWKKIVEQLSDVMVIILLIACVVSAALGEYVEAIVIAAIVILNAALGIYQEGRAENAIASLQKMAAPHARLIRDGVESYVPAADLVPGDLVIVEAGDIVPADIRLIESVNLQADESSLTGESVPVEKDWRFEPELTTVVGDRANMLHMSTPLTAGHGRGIVVGTGQNTEIGKIAGRLAGIEQDATPLQKNLSQLGKWLGMICVIVCALVFVEGMLESGPKDYLLLFMTAVSLAVAAIPEGLPAIVTIVLSQGMKRMAERNAIVRRLLAVETLGSVDVICSDKTGTLTQNEMTVTRIYAGDELYSVSGTGYDPAGDILGDTGRIDFSVSSRTKDSAAATGDSATAEAGGSAVALSAATASYADFANTVAPPATSAAILRRLLIIGALCNEAALSEADGVWSVIGDPTEGSLLTAAAKSGLSLDALRAAYPRVAEIPFDSERKMMSVCNSGLEEIGAGATTSSADATWLTKGAPDLILDRCKYELTAEGVVPLTEGRKTEIMEANSKMARLALRVLAFAQRPADDTLSTATHPSEVEQDLIFVGLMGMIDPPRPEAKVAITKAQAAGIRVIMITGDYAETAVAIGVELGIFHPGDSVLTGRELEQMSDEALTEEVRTTSIFARVSPEHKVRIVAALRANGYIVSMTGDGVNDAPALKQADIGVAMGITGTEVSREASDMILTDDNFATIVSAVEEGRIIFANIRKFVSFLLSCNVGEILVIFITSIIWGAGFAPLLPIQLLWLNLITDSLPALALGNEKGEPDIMEQPPRGRGESIINREMVLGIVTQSLAIFGAVYIAFMYGLQTYGYGAAGPHHGARTMAFITLILAELLRTYSSRSSHISIFRIGILSNSAVVKGTLISALMMLLVVYLPGLNTIFKTVMPSLADWGVIIGLSLVPFIVGEAVKPLNKLLRKKS
ncbi:MAG: cation-translocating P-type ATPase [Clostridiaceae bacterium]|nr:cation-translocating P-type ATPase [Clostridiaceae bacterium]